MGDIYDTPLEYLSKVRDDREHAELAWLASRALYGDLRTTLRDADVERPPDRATDGAGGAAAARELGMERLAVRLEGM